jgi:hypothetical protein
MVEPGSGFHQRLLDRAGMVSLTAPKRVWAALHDVMSANGT